MRNQILFLLLTFILSCTTSPRIKKAEPQPASPQVKELYQSAVNLVENKKYAKALSQLQDIVNNNPQMVLANESRFLIGQIYERLGQKQQAFQSYMEIVQSPYFSGKEFRARLEVAQYLIEKERYEEALSYIDSIIKTDQVRPEILKRAHLLRVDIFYYKQQNIPALESLIELSEISEKASSKEAYKMRALDLVNSNLTKNELMQIVGQRKFGFVRSAAFYQLGKMFFEEKDFSRASNYLKSAISVDENSRYAELSQHIIEQIRARSDTDPYTIGAVLPLSGRLAPIGQRSLQGLQLGLGIFDKKRSNFTLSVVDSEANAQTAQNAVEKLVIEDHISALVGSLLSKTAFEVAETASDLGVPSLALSQRSGLQDIGSNVFQHALTSRMQVEKLVDTAMRDNAMTRFAILYPDDPYGREFANLFWDVVLEKGGQITAVQKYETGETDFKSTIKRLVGTYYTEAREDEHKLLLDKWKEENKSSRKDAPQDLLSPIIEFDAIFIPDSSKALGQIAPMLDYNDVDGVKLLGTNLWNTRSFLRRIGKYGKQTLFVDSYLPTTASPEQQRFENQYQRVFGEKPDAISIQAYEAAKILRYLIEEGYRSRGEIQKGLANIKNFPGITGELTMSDKREIEKPITVLSVEKGQIVRAN